MARPDNAEELALLAEEIGAEVIHKAHKGAQDTEAE